MQFILVGQGLQQTTAASRPTRLAYPMDRRFEISKLRQNRASRPFFRQFMEIKQARRPFHYFSDTF